MAAAKLLRGVTRALTLAITDRAGEPVSFVGATVKVILRADGSAWRYEPSLTINGNEVSFGWNADNQPYSGGYTIMLIADYTSGNVNRVVWHGDTSFVLVDYSYQEEGDTEDVDASGVFSLAGSWTVNGASAYEIWLGAGHTGDEDVFLDWLRQPAADEAESVAAAEALRVEAEAGRVSAEQGRVAAETARERQAASDHATAEADHSAAEADHTQAVSDHTQASADHTTAAADHGIAASDHTAAAADHTQAGGDHSRAESDHTTAASDHSQAGTDHTRAEGDHATAGQDHTQAGSDHTTAVSDHTTAASDHSQAGTDHTTAAGDHTTAAADHTQAVADHAVMAGYDTRLGNVEDEVSQLGQEKANLDEIIPVLGIDDADNIATSYVVYATGAISNSSNYRLYQFNVDGLGCTRVRAVVGDGDNAQASLAFYNSTTIGESSYISGVRSKNSASFMVEADVPEGCKAIVVTNRPPSNPSPSVIILGNPQSLTPKLTGKHLLSSFDELANGKADKVVAVPAFDGEVAVYDATGNLKKSYLGKAAILDAFGDGFFEEEMAAVDLSAYPEQGLSLSSIWYGNPAVQKHIAIPVSPGEKMTLSFSAYTGSGSATGWYVFCTNSYNPPYNSGDAIPSTGSEKRIALALGSSVNLVAPLNAAYLILTIVDGASQRCTWSLQAITSIEPLTSVRLELDKYTKPYRKITGFSQEAVLSNGSDIYVQGMCYDGTNIWYYCDYSDTLYKYKVSDGTVTTYNVDLAHANSLTYNPKTGLIYAATFDAATFKTFNPATQEVLDGQTLEGFTGKVVSIAYSKENDVYVILGGGFYTNEIYTTDWTCKRMYIYDHNFNLIKSFTLENDNCATQGLDCDAKYIYMPKSYYTTLEGHKDKIVIYDFNGKKICEVMSEANEYEDIAKIDNNHFYLAKNVGNTPTITLLTVSEETTLSWESVWLNTFQWG